MAGYYATNTSEKNLRKLERGVVVTVFCSSKKKPENVTLRAILETKEIICILYEGGKPEYRVYLPSVKEVRPGLNSPDFERWPDETAKYDPGMAMAIFHGLEFNLSCLSIVALDPNDFPALMEGMTQLVSETKVASYQIQKERWLWKEFYKIQKNEASAYGTDRLEKQFYIKTLRDLKSWLAKMNYKLKNKEAKRLLKHLKLKEKMVFQEFYMLFEELVHSDDIISKHFNQYLSGKTGERQMRPERFVDFLQTEQNETFSVETAKLMIKHFVDDQMRGTLGSMHFTEKEFYDYLLSPDNSVWNPEQEQITMDMSQPLCDYWIASSHNTYLTGNQMNSDSSVETYARALRMGCRCVELDCWDGTDGIPIIRHGKTLTSSVKFDDVVKMIKANAWQTSEFPVILSLENHCSLQQQRHMASVLKETFKDELVTAPLDAMERQLPSPELLRRRILIKDRKLKVDEGSDEKKFSLDVRKSGILHILDQAERAWVPLKCVLTEKELMYSPKDDYEGEDVEDDEADEYEDYDSEDENIEMEPWFHGKLSRGRREAEELLKEKKSHGDGTYLVRERDNGSGYSISFWLSGKANHCRIQSRVEDDGTKIYYFNDSTCKTTVKELLDYYRENPLYLATNKSVLLNESIYHPPDYITQPWYFSSVNRRAAEEMLRRNPEDGRFLVRPGSAKDSFALSFRYHGKIRHFRISKHCGPYVLGLYRFSSLVKLVDFFKKSPLYRKMKLGKPAVGSTTDQQADDCDIYGCSIYSDPNSPEGLSMVNVKALYDFRGNQCDQMTFRRGALIRNVKEEDCPWWRGDLGDMRQLLFPANYVEVIPEKEDDKTDLEKESGIIDLAGGIVEISREVEGKKNVLNIFSNKTAKPFVIGFDHHREMTDWGDAIRSNVAALENRDRKRSAQEGIDNRAVELSDLVVYCRAVAFDTKTIPGRHSEMSSLSESKIAPFLTTDRMTTITNYNCYQLSRIYPKALRITSDNYDPVPMWTSGCQMVALNYQTPDKPMQLNQGWFRQNGKCGYVLKPPCMREAYFNPFDLRTLSTVPKLSLTITIHCGRLLTVGACLRPFIVMEVMGIPIDNKRIRTGLREENNGLTPVWDDEAHVLDIVCPPMALLRFELCSDNEVIDQKVLAQATIPVLALRAGFRSVPLQNAYSENLPLSSLLIHLAINDTENESLSRIAEEVRNMYQTLASLNRDPQKVRKLMDTEKKILESLEEKKKNSNIYGEFTIPRHKKT
ncbi:1-phosphatidylinositol 4,5-bisphosphate phosphodiesterase gamma-1-like isoform X2 [Haliotis cracherodii]|uniref:1-phosphatidylinositol 4,5-bisphosphate phosphodiesterase gamma-1-like isoform X2 n=1 Tax=Haliotis cracherodii TaxID=6455 RepID=UPI0039EB48A3